MLSVQALPPTPTTAPLPLSPASVRNMALFGLQPAEERDPLQYRWFRNRVALLDEPLGGGHMSGVCDSTLCFEQSTREDAGEYHCDVTCSDTGARVASASAFYHVHTHDQCMPMVVIDGVNSTRIQYGLLY